MSLSGKGGGGVGGGGRFVRWGGWALYGSGRWVCVLCLGG